MKAFSIKLDTKSERALTRLARIEDRPKGYIIRRLIIEADQDVKRQPTGKPEARLGSDGMDVMDGTMQAVEEMSGERQEA